MAIHAVEEVEVEAAVGAVEGVRESGLSHRIEHASICPPSLIARMKAANIMVVTQPGFIYHSGDRYLEHLAEKEITNLYPLKAWLDAGLAVSASSDAPVVPPEPLAGIQAAILRRARTGQSCLPSKGYRLSRRWDSMGLGRRGRRGRGPGGGDQ